MLGAAAAPLLGCDRRRTEITRLEAPQGFAVTRERELRRSRDARHAILEHSRLPPPAGRVGPREAVLRHRPDHLRDGDHLDCGLALLRRHQAEEGRPHQWPESAPRGAEEAGQHHVHRRQWSAQGVLRHGRELVQLQQLGRMVLWCRSRCGARGTCRARAIKID
eukprot:scaffold5655_cov66-Phaeocystis_antarctica.AAC.1